MRARRSSKRIFLAPLLACFGALASCATVSVAPGHRAVLMTADGALSVLGEGVTDVPALSVIDDFDLTEQAQGGTFTAITADGVPVLVRDPSVSYQLVASELVEADRSVGADHLRSLIAPIVQSSVARVLATYRFADLTSDHLREAQERINQLAAARLRPLHIALGSVELKGITPRLPALAGAITETSIWEQRSAQSASRLEVARQRADALRARAAGIASANRSVTPTLSAAVLEQKATAAWQQLLVSPSVTVRVSSGGNDRSPSLEVAP